MKTKNCKNLHQLPSNLTVENCLKNFRPEFWSLKNGTPIPKSGSAEEKVLKALQRSHHDKRNFLHKVAAELKKYPSRQVQRGRFVFFSEEAGNDEEISTEDAPIENDSKKDPTTIINSLSSSNGKEHKCRKVGPQRKCC